jgi:hypothetical protein
MSLLRHLRVAVLVVALVLATLALGSLVPGSAGSAVLRVLYL